MIRILIADEDASSISSIRTFLSGERDISIVAECANGIAACQKLDIDEPDIFIVDVELPEMSGFEILEFARHTGMPYIIFTSISNKYAVRAFEFNVVDYLIKPFSRQRFRDALSRVREYIQRDIRAKEDGHFITASQVTVDSVNYHRNSVERVPIRIGRRIRLMQTAAVQYITADRDFTNLHMATGETIRTSERISQLEIKLHRYEFQRIHRSRILNLRHVREILPRNTQYEFVMRTGECFMSGILYKRELNALITTWNKPQQAA